MATEEEIRQKILMGKEPADLIEEGYKKSTVYEIFSRLNSLTIRDTHPILIFEHFNFSQDRYQPDQECRVSFEIRNNVSNDVYLYTVGIQPEWVKDQWIGIDAREIIHPGEAKEYIFSFKIPRDLNLDEYEIRFGVEGNFLFSPSEGIPPEPLITWSEPVTLDVKMPKNGMSIFISHSTKDMNLIRQLEKYLDIYGIDAIIGEDVRHPGRELEDKFYSLISQSQYFLAILTEYGLDSEWVKKEVNYAYTIKKPLLLLVDQDAEVPPLPIEYIPFSKIEPIECIIDKIKDGLKSVQINFQQKSSSPNFINTILMAALIGFLGGLLIANRFNNRSNQVVDKIQSHKNETDNEHNQ